MTLSFRDMQANDLESVFFNPNEYGETLYFVPASTGTQRTIYGDAERTQTYEPGIGDEDSVEGLTIDVRKHATEGIVRPQQGDRIAWDHEGSGTSARWYVYTRTLEDNGLAMTLLFTRDIPTKTGGLPSR
jgi:hypothetical protein